MSRPKVIDVEHLIRSPTKQPSFISGLSRDELLLLKAKYDEQCERLESQLARARQKAKTTGNIADPAWFEATRVELKKLSRRRIIIENRLSAMRRKWERECKI